MELLSVSAHRQLRVARVSGAGCHFAQVVPSELARIATRVPVLMTKHPDTGRFYIGAVFGFSPGENLLADRNGTFHGVAPLDWDRAAFYVEGEAIAIDPDHPRFSDDQGTPLFDEVGGATDALKRIQRALALLETGLRESESFVDAMLDAKLVEPIDVSLSFDDGERVNLDGLYTVSRDALAGLTDTDVVRLFRAGHIQLALTMIDSLNQIPLLARSRNDRLTA